MSLVAHRFGRVEFRILNFEYLLLFSSGRGSWKNQNQILSEIRNLTRLSPKLWGSICPISMDDYVEDCN